MSDVDPANLTVRILREIRDELKGQRVDFAKRFEKIDERFEKIDERFEKVTENGLARLRMQEVERPKPEVRRVHAPRFSPLRRCRTAPRRSPAAWCPCFAR